MALPQYTPSPIWHPTISEVDDSNPPFASNWNPGLQGLADNVEYLFANRAHAALNWSPEIDVTTITSASLVGDCAWDGPSRRWLMLNFVNGGTPLAEVWASYGLDQGLQWTQLGSPVLPGAAITFSAVCADPATAGDAWQALATAASFNVYLFDSGSWTSKRSNTRTPNDVQLATLGNTVIFAASYTDGSPSSDIYGSPDHGATWLGSSGFPAVIAWELKTNGLPIGSGGQAIAFPAFAGSATFNYWTSNDGQAWSIQHLPALDGGTAKVVGVSWTRDATGPCWILFVQATSTTTAIYRSPDGLAWTLVAAGPSNRRPQAELAALPYGMLVATEVENTSTTPSGQVWSPDGGVSWYQGQAYFSSNLAVGAGYTRPRVVAGDIGFLAWNAKWLRFSQLAGLPPKLT